MDNQSILLLKKLVVICYTKQFPNDFPTLSQRFPCQLHSLKVVNLLQFKPVLHLVSTEGRMSVFFR